MAMYIVSDAGANMRPLTGIENYKEWSQEFQIASQYRGIWGLYTGEERGVRKPSPRHCPDGWEVEQERYSKYLQKLEYAKAFLAESVDIKLRDEIQKFEDPEQAWAYLKKEYTQPPLTMAYLKLQDIQLNNCKSMGYYLRKIKETREEINNLQGQCSDSSCKIKMIGGLQPEYVSAVARVLNLEEINTMTVKEFADKLLELEIQMQG